MKNKKSLKLIIGGFLLAVLVVIVIVLAVNGSKKKNEVLSEKETSYKVSNLTDITDYVNDRLVGKENTNYYNNENGDTISKDEEVWTIVTLSQTPLLEKYLSTKMDVPVSDYVSSFESRYYSNHLVTLQNSLYEKVKDYCLSEIKYNYTTLVNGFSVRMKYGDVSKVEKITGVDSVIISERYYAQETESVESNITENVVNVYPTGIYDSSNVKYTGKGTIVAVLDTGLDYTHTAFQVMPEGEVVYSYDDISQLVSNTTAYKLSLSKDEAFTLTGNDVYISKKVPWAYDYADKDANVYPVNDHGTHVAGIIAGKDSEITGVAVDAQLAIMKVFSDKDRGAETDDILAALEDCIYLNVDVINMSLGTSCGFTREKDDDKINTIYDGIKEAGISLICAASNDYSAAMGSDNGDTNLTSNPDSGTVGSPSSYAAAMSIASISGVKTPYFNLNGEAIYYTESSDTTGEQNKFMDELLGSKNELTLEYVTIPGLGISSDYIGLDVRGKVAVIHRGDITFEEKIKTAEAKGAVAAIIYNNQSGTITMSVGNDTKIPSCSISMDMGTFFEKQTTGTLIFSKDNLAGPFMSGFSSWGVLPDLELKPDIAAHGGDIYSAVRGGYDRLSGTSMACPNMAGATTLVRQYVKERYPELKNAEITNLTYQLMMSTTTIALNEYGNPYSPRKQGAGLADILKATTTDAYLSVDGSNKTKLSLGDDPTKSGKYELVFNLNNISNKTQSYKVNTNCFTETVSTDGKTVAERAYMFNDYGVSVEVTNGVLSNGHVIVKGYDTAVVKVTLTLTSEQKAYLDKNFVNGMFVEGYVMLDNDDSEGVDLNIAYVAFYGDWTVAPILDYTQWELDESKFDPSVLEKDKLKAAAYGTIPMGGFRYLVSGNEYEDASWGLGVYGYNLAEGYEKPQSFEEYASITEDEDGLYMLRAISAGLIRGAKTITMSLRNANTGELIYEGVYENGRKSHYSGGRTGGYIEIDLSAKEYGLINNTKYSFEMSCALDWEGEQHNLKNTFSFDFYVDSERPVILEDQTKVRIKEDVNGNKTYFLDMYIYDNHCLQCYSIISYDYLKEDGTYEGRKPIIENTIPIESARGVTTKVTLDITDYWKDLVDQDKSISVEVIDYARNYSVCRFKLPDTIAESIRFTQDSYTMKANAEYDLFKLIEMNPSDSFKHLVNFTSSDESVVIVGGEGDLYSVGEGTATITATTSKGAYATIDIIVSGNTGKSPTLKSIDLGRNVLSMVQGEEYVINAKCDPWYYDSSNVEVQWRTTNSKIAQITVDPDDPFKVTVKAIATGTCGVVCSSGKYITSKLTVNVKEEFVVESRYLKKYNGRGDENGVVIIPDDKGIIYINRYAFYDNDYITKIVIPEGVTTIDQAAIYGCENLKEIVMPESMEKIEMFGIGWNPNLEKVDLGGTKTIQKYGFVYDQKLKDIDLSNVRNVGYGCFLQCISLESIDISNLGGMGELAFAYCSSLKEVTMSERTALLGNRSFYRCTALESLTIPTNYVTTATFAYCTGLTNVTFTNDVMTIDEAAFAYCTKLQSVSYLKTVNTIAQQAFQNCSSLKNVYIPSGLVKLDSLAYASCENIEMVTISRDAKIKNVSLALFADSKNLKEFVVEEGNAYLSSRDGILLDKSGKELLLVPSGFENTTFTVYDSVKVIAPFAFSGISVLESIDLNNAEVVSTGAFYACTNLNTVNSTKLKEIGDNAFYACHKLGAYQIPETVEYIGKQAFAGIENEDEVKYTLNIPANVSYIGDSAFENNNTIEYVTFSSGSKLKALGNKAFKNNVNLKKVTFVSGLETIGDYTFSDCTALTQVSYPKTVTEFGKGNYYNCSSLQFAYLPQSITYVPEFTFYGCTGFSVYKATSNIKEIKEYAFYGSRNLTSVDLGTVKAIGAYAFTIAGITNVQSLYVETIGDSAFMQSTLQRIYFTNLKTIGNSAFAGCNHLADITIPNVESIGNYAFNSCTGLTKLELNNLKKVGDYAFVKTNLSVFNAPNLEEVGTFAFSYSTINTFNVGKNLTNIHEKAFSYAFNLRNFTVNSENTVYFEEDGVLYKNLPNGYTELVSYPSAKTRTEYTIKSNTVRVAAAAFSGNQYLQTIDLPQVMRQLGDGCFADTIINTYKFHSFEAPALESSFVSTRDTYYMNFNNYFERADQLSLTMFVPKNGNGYNEYLYQKYFSLTNITDEMAASEDTLYLKELISKLPATITLEDKDMIEEAANIYNILSKDMKKLITQEELQKLEAAKAALSNLLG